MHTEDTKCDNCGEAIGATRAARYEARWHSGHDCSLGHFCSTGCYEEKSGWGDFR